MCKGHGNSEICILFHPQLWQASWGPTYGDQVLHREVSSWFRRQPRRYKTLWFHAGGCLLFHNYSLSICFPLLSKCLVYLNLFSSILSNVVVGKWRQCRKPGKYSSMKLISLSFRFLKRKSIYMYLSWFICIFLKIHSEILKSIWLQDFDIRLWITYCVNGGSLSVRDWSDSTQYQYWKRNLFGALMLLQE